MAEITTSIDTLPRRSDAAARLGTLGRTLIAFLFVVSGAQKAFTFADVAAWMTSLGLPYVPWVLSLTIALEIGGGIALALGIGARLLSWTLAAFVIAATIVFHAFWSSPAEQFGDQLTHFLKNLAIVGGLLLVVVRKPR